MYIFVHSFRATVPAVPICTNLRPHKNFVGENYVEFRARIFFEYI